MAATRIRDNQLLMILLAGTVLVDRGGVRAVVRAVTRRRPRATLAHGRGRA